MPDPPRSYRLPRSHRLGGRARFDAVFQNRLRKNVGPLGVLARPNDLGYHRLGLSVSRRVGNAVRRNRLKRLLREAFRLDRHQWPGSYDWVVTVRPHDPPLSLDDYRRLLATAATRIDRENRRRRNRQRRRDNT